MKYLASLIIICLFFSGVQPQNIPDQNKFYFIALVENNEVLENPGHLNPKYPKDVVSEAKLITAKRREKDDSQLWKFMKVSADNNSYMIVNKKHNNYMDVPYSRKNAGETFFGHPNKGGTNQQFYLFAMPGNIFFLSSKVSGLMLTKVRKNERHCLYREEEQRGVWSMEGKCGDMVSANYIKQEGFTGDKNQQWKLIETYP